jgi:CBS domain containing-hemolysin-like protein
VNGADWVLLGAVLVLIVLAAITGASEVVISRVNKIRAYHLQEQEQRGAASLVKVAEDPAPHLNVMLLLSLLFQLSGTTIATVVAVRTFRSFGEVVATVTMTILLFVFAEVTPKTFAVLHTDRAALRLAPIIVAMRRLLGPVAFALIKVANAIMPGKGLPAGPFVTEAEIKAMAEMASEEEAIEEDEKELIHSIFEFGDTIVREVMVPRPDMVTVSSDASTNDVLEVVIAHGFSRIPVHEGNNADEIVAIVYAKDVLRQVHAGRTRDSVRDIGRRPTFVPESKKVAELLRDMQREKFHLSIVVDEYGSVVGLATLEDLIEEIVGEIEDEYDREEPNVEPAGENRLRVNARLPVDELSELVGVELPNTEWDTVGGLMMGILGRLPAQGETVEFDQLRFTAERVQGRRIAKILVEHPPAAPVEPADA